MKNELKQLKRLMLIDKICAFSLEELDELEKMIDWRRDILEATKLHEQDLFNQSMGGVK